MTMEELMAQQQQQQPSADQPSADLPSADEPSAELPMTEEPSASATFSLRHDGNIEETDIGDVTEQTEYVPFVCNSWGFGGL